MKTHPSNISTHHDSKMHSPIAALRHHVTGAIERGEKQAILEMGIAALDEESAIAATQDIIRQAEEQAASMGKRAGESAALWVIQDTWGGRVTRGEREAASAFLRAMEEGDELPEPPNLSGEWSGDETPSSLMASCFGEDWQDNEDFRDAQDDICSAWEIAASDAFFSTLCQSAESVLS
jgi:hypothetical protein